MLLSSPPRCGILEYPSRFGTYATHESILQYRLEFSVELMFFGVVRAGGQRRHGESVKAGNFGHRLSGVVKVRERTRGIQELPRRFRMMAHYKWFFFSNQIKQVVLDSIKPFRELR